MGRFQDRQSLPLTVLEHQVVAGLAQPDGRERLERSAGVDGEGDNLAVLQRRPPSLMYRRLPSRLRVRCIRGVLLEWTLKRAAVLVEKTQRHGLRDSCAGLNFDGERQAQRRAKGFETGINPVALVLHFEYLTGEAQLSPDSWSHLMRERNEIVQPGQRLFRGYAPWKRQLFSCAIRAFDSANGARAFPYGMEHTKPEAIAQERGARFAIEGESDFPGSFSCDFPAPKEVDLTLSVDHIVDDAKGIVARIQSYVRKEGRDCAPIAVAHGGVNATDDFPLTQPDVA
jgi:hypothetical protein